MIGLKRGTVALLPHDEQWEKIAADTIIELKNIFGKIAVDIQHVGSTSIKRIKAKPIIDIAVAVNDFDEALKSESRLKNAGFYYSPKNDMPGQRLWACGSYYDGTGDLQTHFIHIVLSGSMEWINYINFRDYLNETPSVADDYEKLKVFLAEAAPAFKDREKYTNGKRDFIVYTLRKALVWSFLGKTVDVKIDRPLGYIHKKEKYSLTYPINYGYIPGVIGGDGEELDVYVLGIAEPLDEFTGKVIAIINRKDDVEDKLVAAPIGSDYTLEDVENAVKFQEQYYDTVIEML